MEEEELRLVSTMVLLPVGVVGLRSKQGLGRRENQREVSIIAEDQLGGFSSVFVCSCKIFFFLLRKKKLLRWEVGSAVWFGCQIKLRFGIFYLFSFIILFFRYEQGYDFSLFLFLSAK